MVITFTLFFLAPSFDRDADVLMDILAPRHRPFVDRPNQSSSATAMSSSATSETEAEGDKGEINFLTEDMFFFCCCYVFPHVFARRHELETFLLLT